jgi:predicted PurR-regulated permease PerM
LTELRPIDPAPPSEGEDKAALVAVAAPALIVPDGPTLTPLTIFVGGLFILALFTALFVAQSVILPLIFAILLNLLLKPLIRWLNAMRVPSALAALVTVLLLIGFLVALVTPLVGPATDRANQMPKAVEHLADRLSLLREPIILIDKIVRHAEQATQAAGATSQTVAVQHFDLVGALIAGLRAIVDGLVTTGIVLFFVLMSGDVFLRRFVEILPTFRNKRQAVDISQQIERDISAYLLTITGMNALVGVATGTAMYFCGLGDPLLWGVMAFALNYIPVFGPLTGIAVLLLAGFMAFENNFLALLPAGIFLAIHVAEGEILTPLLLAKRFTINPVAMILALVFWYWMWGIPGAILAMPMLAIAKIACDRIAMLNSVGHVLEA